MATSHAFQKVQGSGNSQDPSQRFSSASIFRAVCANYNTNRNNGENSVGNSRAKVVTVRISLADQRWTALWLRAGPPCPGVDIHPT